MSIEQSMDKVLAPRDTTGSKPPSTLAKNEKMEMTHGPLTKKK